eukprot:14595571-Alexandrium_andersonii.AAC.1
MVPDCCSAGWTGWSHKVVAIIKHCPEAQSCRAGFKAPTKTCLVLAVIIGCITGGWMPLGTLV